MSNPKRFRLTPLRLATLAVVRCGLVQRDLVAGHWLINANPALRWHGRTLSELDQAGLITVDRKHDRKQSDPPAVILTATGESALGPPS